MSAHERLDSAALLFEDRRGEAALLLACEIAIPSIEKQHPAVEAALRELCATCVSVVAPIL